MNAQQLIIGHLLPIGAAIAVLWLAYRLLFINSNRLRFNRLFLLAAMLFSLVLPLLGLWVGTEAPQVVSLKQNLFGGTMLGENLGINGNDIIINEEPYKTPLLNLQSQSHHEQAVEAEKIGYAYSNNIVIKNADTAYSTYFANSGHMDFTDLPLFSPVLAKNPSNILYRFYILVILNKIRH